MGNKHKLLVCLIFFPRTSYKNSRSACNLRLESTINKMQIDLQKGKF